MIRADPLQAVGDDLFAGVVRGDLRSEYCGHNEEQQEQGARDCERLPTKPPKNSVASLCYGRIHDHVRPSEQRHQ